MSHGQKPNSCYFNHDQISSQERKFYYFGKLAAVAILGGMGAPKIFCPLLTDFILNLSSLDGDLQAMVNDLHEDNACLRGRLKDIVSCTSEADCSKMMSGMEERFDFGFGKANIQFKEKKAFIQAAVKHFTISSSLERPYHLWRV